MEMGVLITLEKMDSLQSWGAHPGLCYDQTPGKPSDCMLYKPLPLLYLHYHYSGTHHYLYYRFEE